MLARTLDLLAAGSPAPSSCPAVDLGAGSASVCPPAMAAAAVETADALRSWHLMSRESPTAEPMKSMLAPSGVRHEDSTVEPMRLSSSLSSPVQQRRPQPAP
jgi:hypothetical protein